MPSIKEESKNESIISRKSKKNEANISVKSPNKNKSFDEDKVVMKEKVCHKYCTDYEIDLDALQD